MREYNKITKELIAEGYTAQDHPPYVKVASGGSLDNFYGGFEFVTTYIDEMTFMTPCGLHCKGKEPMTGMSLGGIEWSFENDCPTIICPFYKKDCEMNDEILREHYKIDPRCAVHRTSKEWTFEGSVEEQNAKNSKEAEDLKRKFIEEHGGRVCENHMKFNRATKEWSFHYDPTVCAQGYCRVLNTSFKDGSQCPVLGKVISNDKGNVFYDVRYSGRDYTKDGTIFEGERFEAVVKDVPLYSKPIRFEIAEVIAKTQERYIKFMFRYNTRIIDSWTLFRAEKGEIDLSWSIENIRAEKKLTRDLEADLLDIENGVKVTHEFDEQRKKKQEKSDRRKASKDKMIRHLESRILKEGFDNLDLMVKKRMIKILGNDRISCLKAEHKKRQEEEKNAPKQMSIFDLIEA